MPLRDQRSTWLPKFNYQVWILAIGRLLSQTGSGFTLFYAPIFFVNQVGLSATQVGLGLGSAAVSGVGGRVMGGSFSDSPTWGRKRTLLLSAAISAIASFVLAAAHNFPMFVAGNLLMGLGIGLFWPASEAMIADLTTPIERNEAFALNRLCDSLGLGLGVVLGGAVISLTPAYWLLFVIDGISFLVLLAVVHWALAETYKPGASQAAIAGWGEALRDRRLLTFSLVNVLFTTYIIQLNSTMPLYFTNFVWVSETSKGFSPIVLSALFTGHLVLMGVVQLPVARWLNRVSRVRALELSVLLWSLGFGLVWVTGVTRGGAIVWASLVMVLLSLATVTYLPAASSIVVDLAPVSLRGVYLAVNSQCWAIGQLIGPPLGGWALDNSPTAAHAFWLGLALSGGAALWILRVLGRMLAK
ncbi:MAG TPA: MFS transporter [Thermosynechococcaceae cyanobacterium]